MRNKLALVNYFYHVVRRAGGDLARIVLISGGILVTFVGMILLPNSIMDLVLGIAFGVVLMVPIWFVLKTAIMPLLELPLRILVRFVQLVIHETRITLKRIRSRYKMRYKKNTEAPIINICDTTIHLRKRLLTDKGSRYFCCKIEKMNLKENLVLVHVYNKKEDLGIMTLEEVYNNFDMVD